MWICHVSNKWTPESKWSWNLYFPKFMAEFRVLTSISGQPFSTHWNPGAECLGSIQMIQSGLVKKKHTLWSSNVAGLKIPYYRWFSQLETSILFGDLPATHAWLAEGAPYISTYSHKEPPFLKWLVTICTGQQPRANECKWILSLQMPQVHTSAHECTLAVSCWLVA